MRDRSGILQKTYKPKEIYEATGMNKNEFSYCRRKMKIKAHNTGSASEYTEQEVMKIVNAYHHLFPVRPTSEAKVEELKATLKNNGY